MVLVQIALDQECLNENNHHTFGEVVPYSIIILQLADISYTSTSITHLRSDV